MLMKVSGLVRLTRDVELVYGNSGTAIAKVGIASSEKYGEKETQLFLDAVAFGKQAENLQKYAGTKGTQIYLTGKLQTESWEKDGQKRSKTSMVIEGFDFVSNKQSNSHSEQPVNNSQPQYSNAPQGGQAKPFPEMEVDSDTVPF